MNDTGHHKEGFRFTKEIGLSFIAIVIQLLVFSFGFGATYYRLDDNVSKVNALLSRFDKDQQINNKKFESLSVFVGEVKANYEAIKDRLVRVEQKMDNVPIKN